MTAERPLQMEYLRVHPQATTGLSLCEFFEEHPGQAFTHSELKRRLGCSDRIIREHVPEALNQGRQRIAVDKSASPGPTRTSRDARTATWLSNR